MRGSRRGTSPLLLVLVVGLLMSGLLDGSNGATLDIGDWLDWIKEKVTAGRTTYSRHKAAALRL